VPRPIRRHGAQGVDEGAEIRPKSRRTCAAAYAFVTKMVSPRGQAILAESSGTTRTRRRATICRKLIEENGSQRPEGLSGQS